MREIYEMAFGFEDKKTHDRIKCAYSLNEVCSRDCAACNVQGTDSKAECLRGPGEPFYIGRVVDDPAA